MNRGLLYIFILSGLLLHQCRAVKDLQKTELPELKGVEGMVRECAALDTIHSLLISKAEALLLFDNERYEVAVTLYSKKDSIIYLSAVSNGYEIIRASVDHDSIKVINRLDRIVYRSPLERQFGYQYPVNFSDLQNLINRYYLCEKLHLAYDNAQGRILFEFDEDRIKKRISMDRDLLQMDTFEFYHQLTEKYLMGERSGNGFKIYSNFMITEFEIIASGGELSYNKDVRVRMEVNPRRYTFTELR